MLELGLWVDKPWIMGDWLMARLVGTSDRADGFGSVLGGCSGC